MAYRSAKKRSAPKPSRQKCELCEEEGIHRVDNVDLDINGKDSPYLTRYFCEKHKNSW